MARLHVATLTPTKPQVLAEWVPTQAWGPEASSDVEVVGAFRFDDPEGAVGLETHIVRAGGDLFQVPLTYRDAPLDGADDALVTRMEHSALGTRWVYDGVRDPRFVMMLAAVAMTGQGEALGLAENEGRWFVAPSPIRIVGGGWTQERVPVDGFDLVSDDEGGTVLRSDRFELTVHRRPTAGARPAMGLTASWDGQADVVLAEVQVL